MSEKVLREFKIIETDDGFRLRGKGVEKKLVKTGNSRWNLCERERLIRASRVAALRGWFIISCSRCPLGHRRRRCWQR